METNELTEKIIGCAYEVSNALGSGFPESVYEKALHHQALKTDLTSERHADLPAHQLWKAKNPSSQVCSL